MTHYAILGARGMLGTDVRLLCQERGITYGEYDLPDFDITDESQIRSALEGATACVNCAAYTNVEKAESEEALAIAVNGDAVGTMGKIAAEMQIPVLHISTDFVFDGTLDRPYKETDATNPISAYGRSKLIGEQKLMESGCEHCIIRVQWTYGMSGNNFVTKIISAAKERDKLNVVDDQIGAPTPTSEVAKAMLEMLEKNARGLYQYAASGYTSRYEMASFLLKIAGIDTPVDPCKTSDYKTAAQRPLNSRFDCSKIQQVLDEPIKHWQQSLEQFVKEL